MLVVCSPIIVVETRINLFYKLVAPLKNGKIWVDMGQIRVFNTI